MEIGLLILGLSAGILSGLFGIGGGVLIVPVLLMFFGMDMLSANATSLAAMVLPVGIFGVIQYYKSGLLNIKFVLWISAGLIVGSFFGAEIATAINDHILTIAYTVFLLYVCLSFWGVFGYIGKAIAIPKGNIAIPKNIYTLLVMGFFAGIIAGMFGKGGGIVIVPILVGLFGFSYKEAAATSLAALLPPVGLPAIIIYAQNGNLDILYAGLIAGGLIVGTLFGSKMAIKLPSVIFKKLYAFFLLVVVVQLVVKLF